MRRRLGDRMELGWVGGVSGWVDGTGTGHGAGMLPAAAIWFDRTVDMHALPVCMAWQADPKGSMSFA